MQDSYVYITSRLQKMGYKFTAKSDAGGAKVIVSDEDNTLEVTGGRIIYSEHDYEIIEEPYELSAKLRELDEEMQEIFDWYFECEYAGTFSIYCPLNRA
jgi:hypothetical protein